MNALSPKQTPEETLLADIFPTEEHKLGIFQEELNTRWITFGYEDNNTWPQIDGLYLGIDTRNGRTDAIILQWHHDEPPQLWRSVQRYVAIEDILPTAQEQANG